MDQPEPHQDLTAPAPPAVPKPRRPLSVTILLLGVLSITVVNLVRFVLGLGYRDFLASQPGVPWLYIILTGLIWTAAGSILCWGLWRAKQWAPRLMQAMALTYAAYYWLDHLFLVDHPARGAAGAQRALLPVNWSFAAGTTVVCLAYVTWVLGRRKVQAFFLVAPPVLPPDQAKTNEAR